MNARMALHLGLASTVLMAIGIACSAPDPGQVTYTQRIDPNNQGGGGGTPGVDGGSTTGGGTDGGGGGGSKDAGGSGGTGAFAGAASYSKGTTNGNLAAKGQAGHSALPGAAGTNKDPTGLNCMDSKCHGPGGTGSPWGFAGTAYLNATTAAGAGAEIRVIGADGKEFDSVYTDAQGNFWSGNGAAAFPSGASAGARDSNAHANTMLAATNGCNNTAACHLSGANPMLHP
jgi:hypothetical protein